MPALEVASEIYSEYDYKSTHGPIITGNVVSEFPFDYPNETSNLKCDEDGDILVDKIKKGAVQIEHSMSTVLSLVGLQVWRGALLLGDLALHWGQMGLLENKTILELGAGTGLTSFIAAMYSKKVVCTDIDMGGILDLIKLNANRNKTFMKSQFLVCDLDFTKQFSEQIEKELTSVDFVFAADVIYDDTLTEKFMEILEKLLNTPPSKKILIALEKRYVFTLENMESVAPCYETFLTLLDKAKCRNIQREWKIEQLPIDFPQYFKYDRVKELILWQISSEKL